MVSSTRETKLAGRYRNRSDELHGLSIAGPESRNLLAELTRDDVSNEAFKFCAIRSTVVAGVPVILARVSFSGELGYELYCAPPYQLKLYQALVAAGEKYGLKHYGARALMSLRLEKNWGVWTLDFRPDFTARQSGLDAFIDYDKDADFIGKQAALAERSAPASTSLVTLLVETDIDCHHDEAIFHHGACVGYVSSGGYAHYSKQSVAMGYIPAELVDESLEFSVEILGELCPAKLQLQPLVDPQGTRMRS